MVTQNVNSEGNAIAWRIYRNGLLPVTMKKETIPIPKPKQGEVLVEVHSASINPGESAHSRDQTSLCLQCRSTLVAIESSRPLTLHHHQNKPVEWKIPAHAPGFFQKFPRTIGTDFSGVILRTGSNLTSGHQSRFQPGTRVLGMIPVETSVRYGQGSLATHVSVQVENLAAIPASIDASLSSEEAAGLPLVSTTALHLVRKARAGNKVLVLGGSTSVGLILLQMLKAEGAGHIVATASGVKKDTVKARGADEIIDYREEDVVQTLRRNHSRKQFDVILDTVGDFAVFGACAAYLKESGEYANVGASDMKPDGSIWSSLSFLRNLGSLYLPWWLGGVPRKSSWGEFVRGAMPEVTDRYLVTNIVTCPIDSTFTFDDAPKAYERLMTGRALGKIIVNIKHPGDPSVR